MKHTLVVVTLGLAVATPLFAQTGAGSAAATPIAEPLATTAPAASSVDTSVENRTAAGTLARAAITTAVINREPQDTLTSIANDKDRLYYFTELKDMAGQAVTHRWEHDGKVMSEVKFDVGGSRWRVYSSKTLDPSWTGEWKVSVIDASGATVGVNTFSYTEASNATAASASGEAGVATPAINKVPAAPAAAITNN